MKPPTTFHAVSAQAAAIPGTQDVRLASGSTARIKRLSWLQFEALWDDLAELLSALAQASGTPSAQFAETAMPAAPKPDSRTADDGLPAALAAAPQLVLRLAAFSLGETELELADWPPCDVLAVAGAALDINFIQPAGVRAFFSSVAQLGG